MNTATADGSAIRRFGCQSPPSLDHKRQGPQCRGPPSLVHEVEVEPPVRVYFEHVELEMSASHPNSEPTLGSVRPKSPCTNSLMYVPAEATMVSSNQCWLILGECGDGFERGGWRAVGGGRVVEGWKGGRVVGWKGW